jgi:hypothetical protein
MSGNRFRIIIALFASVMLISNSAIGQVQTRVALSIVNSNPAVEPRELRFGVDPAATYNIDTGLGEIRHPPFPPADVFEVRFMPDPNGMSLTLAGTEGSPCDVHPWASPTQLDTHWIKIEPGRNPDNNQSWWPVTITWNMDSVKSQYASVKLLDVNTEGTRLNVDMTTTGSAQISQGNLKDLMIITAGPRDPAAGVDDNEAAGGHFHLKNVPNPADDMTTVRYNLPGPATVTLAVSDVNGQEIARLIDLMQQEAGEHSIAFDTSRLRAGSYFITLTTDGISGTQRMVRTQ